MPSVEKGAALADRPVSHKYNTSDHATDHDALQASRIVRLYAVTFATAATIARLAYAVAR
jgi:hypothetical protein